MVDNGCSQCVKDSGLPVIASVSGGKDSTALSLWLTEQDIKHERVFMNTGWEHECTYEYINGPLQNKIGNITTIKGDFAMPNLIIKKGMFPSRLRRFCTQQLKIIPIIKYLDKYKDIPINATGIRAAESKARSKFPLWEEDQSIGCYQWRPLLHWSEKDVIDIHRKHGLKPNPLYFMGAERVGCWPCIFSRKAEIRLVADISPERIDEIDVLEEGMANNSTYFHTHGIGDKSGAISIRDAVKWSRTSYGGKQYELFDDRPEGCVRWGMCDV